MTESVIAAPIELARQVRSAFGSSDNINVMLSEYSLFTFTPFCWKREQQMRQSQRKGN